MLARVMRATLKIGGGVMVLIGIALAIKISTPGVNGLDDSTLLMLGLLVGGWMLYFLGNRIR